MIMFGKKIGVDDLTKHTCSVCRKKNLSQVYYLYLTADIVGLNTNVYLCEPCAKQFKYEVNSAMEGKK